ncbi:MAG: tape measure protein [Arcobacter sp.]|uniref:tape measure protein n=1 Tax=Arcobacter sp. TaxID=1872629 RepID=UPI003C70979A
MANQTDLKIRISVDKKTGGIKLVGNEFEILNKKTKKSTTQLSAFENKLMNIAKGAASLYILKQAFDVVSSSLTALVTTAGQFETQQSILKTLEGDSESAKKSFEWIKQFTANTPNELLNVSNAFIKAKAYGIDPTNGSLKILGDTASAMGKDITDSVEALADAMVGENERLKEFGIKANALGNEVAYSWTNTSGQAKYVVVKNNSEIIESTLEAIFNSKYQGAMEEQMNTWKGLTSNLSDNYNNFLDDIANRSGIFDAFKLTVGDLNDEFKGLLSNQKDMELIGVALRGTIAGIATSIDFLAGIVIGTMKGFAQIDTIIDQLGNNAQFVFYKIAETWNEIIYQIVKTADDNLPSFIKTRIGLNESDVEKTLNDLNKMKDKVTGVRTKIENRLTEYNDYAAGLDLIRNKISTTTDNFTNYTKSIEKNTKAEIENKKVKKDFGNNGVYTKNDTNTNKDLITANEEYMSLLDSQISLSESALDWNANLEGVANTIQNIAKSSMQLSTIEKKSEKEKLKAQNEFYKLTKDISKDSKQYKTAEINLTKKTKAINEASIQSQIVGYGTLTGAVSQMFDEGSKDAAAFHVVESGLAMVAGIRAILTQGSGDPYTAFARMAAMAASVASLLSSANIAFGGDSVSSSSDSFSAQVENTGTGSVLGDTSKASESITNSLGILEDYARPEFQLLSSMNQSLKSIDEKIGGVSALLIQNGGFAFGEGYTEVSFDDKGLGITFQNQLDKIASAIDPVSNFLGGATDKLTGAILGGLFGKTSVKQKLTDYGINFNNALLSDAIEQINGQAYQTITTKIKKKSWFHSSTKTKVKTYFQGLDDEVERQFSLVLSNLYDTTIQSGEALDTSSADIENSLAKFIVSIGKISTKGKSGEQLQEQISNIFSKIGDDIAQTAFPALTQFQSIGEGLFETLTRVASGMEVAEYYINRLGNSFEDINYKDIVNKQGDVGVEVLTQSIKKLDEAIYGINNGVVQMIENFSGNTEELYNLYSTFEDVRDMLSLVGKESKYLTSDMLLGAGGADELSGALEDYFKNFLNGEEQLTFYTQQMQKEFDNLNISMPSSIEGFKKLIEGIDISTAEGQELLGRIVLLSDDYKSLIDNTEELFYTQVQNALDLDKLSLELFDTAVSAVQKMSDKFTQLTQSVETTVNKLLSNSDGANAQEELIKSFWQKRASIDTLLAKDGNLTDSEASNLSSLISDINSLSTSIQSAQNGDNTDITNTLVNELQSLQDGLDLDNSILKVKVLDSGGNATDVASVGVITALAQALAGTNSNPLDISNFSNGGNLTAANEITFRTSFEAQSALTYADELAKLRTNLSYINLSTVDAGDFFTKLQSLDENAFGNMIEFFNSIGAISNNQVMVNGQLVDLPSYDVGTSYVPYDQVAKIHQGEMVLDKNFSDSLRRYGIPTGGGNISVDMSGVINELKETRYIIRAQANEIKKLRKMTENIESSYLSTNEQGA